MKKVFFKTMMGAGFACMLLTGCVESVKDLYDPNYVIQQYQKNWTDSIGQIDPNQTWNMAKRVTAEINLDGVSNSECEISIYTANPLNSSSKKLAKFVVQEEKMVEFDMPKALNYVFVTAKNSCGLVVNGYFKVADGTVTVGKSVTRADDTECKVTLGDKVDMGNYISNDFYYLEGVSKVESAPWLFGDYIDLIGKYGVFAENQDNASIYANELHLKDGVVFQTLEEGEIELTYIYGATQEYNSFGYFYYTDESEISSATRYVYLADARPRTNLRVNSKSGYLSIVANDNTDMGLCGTAIYNTQYNDEQKCVIAPYTDNNGSKINNHLNDEIYGGSYKLVYFDESGNASYTFPKGVHVVFFISNANDNNEKSVYYSLPSENARCNPYLTNHILSAIFKYKDNLIFGIEDNPWSSTSKDLNDMMFCITGAVDANVGLGNIVEEETEGQEWILACEDLGTTDDFDFNDVVFSVKYVAGATTAVITPLAAGGTMPAQILYNGSAIGQEIHEWFGVSTNTMINTTSRGKAAESVEISVGDDFTMTKEMGGFTIDVNNGTTTVVAPAAGAAPQMILVSDANWSWPYERVRISDAYGLFAEWASSSTTNQDWYTTPTGKTVDGDYSNSSTGEEGTGGSGTGGSGTGGSGSGEGGNTGEGGNIGNEVVVDLNSVTIVKDQFIIPASYFINASEEVKICVTVNTGNPDQQEMYVQFFVEYDYFYGNNTSNQYMEYTITDKISKMKDFGLGVNCSVSKITSITIMCK